MAKVRPTQVRGVPEEGGHQAEQMLGAAPDREAGLGEQLGTCRAAEEEEERRKAAAPALRPHTRPCPPLAQGAPHPTPAPASHQARAAFAAEERRRPGPATHLSSAITMASNMS